MNEVASYISAYHPASSKGNFSKAKFTLLLTFLVLLQPHLLSQHLSVQVKESATGQPVPYAYVRWQSTGQDKEQGSALSDKDGFIILPLTGEHVLLSVTCLGFKTYHDTVFLSGTIVVVLEQDLFNLEAITVTGTRTPHTLKEAPVLTQLISRQEIERVDALTIAEILEAEVPGIELSRHGYGQSMTMQGLEPQYTLVLIDGERMAGETGGNVDYSRLNAANIEKVEIVRGAGSALYGSNAMGGVINVITKKPVKKVDITASFRYAQVNEKNYDAGQIYDETYERDFYRNQDKPNLNANLTLGFRGSNFYSNTYLNFKSADGYVLSDMENLQEHYVKLDTTVIHPLETSAISGMLDYTISQKLGFDADKKWAFEVRGNYYNHEEFPTFKSDWRHDLYKNYTLGGFAKYRVSENDELQLTWNTDVYDKYDVFERLDSTALNYRNVFYNTRLNYVFHYGTRHRIFMGTENLYEVLETDMFATDADKLVSRSVNDAMLVLQDEFGITEKFQAVLGLRSGYHTTFSFHASPSVTLKYQVKDFNFRVNYARGYRSPTLKELYMNWSHLGMFRIIGSTDLKPETNDYFALSADYLNTTQKVNATLIASFNQIHNKIDGIWLDDTTVNYLNLNKVSILNIESMLKWRIHKYVNFKGGYVFTRQMKDKKAVTLSEVSPHAITSQIEFIHAGKKIDLSVCLSGKFFSSKIASAQNDDAESTLYQELYEIHYPTYSLWNLTAVVNYNKHLVLSAGFKNLFDYTAPVVTMNTSPSVGRRYFASITYHF
ncbi:MAG: TonB-dependent receptor [Bacteroidales bacterium]|nr:TonB-dependent receptor [Bacteroidales bacterium]